MLKNKRLQSLNTLSEAYTKCHQIILIIFDSIEGYRRCHHFFRFFDDIFQIFRYIIKSLVFIRRMKNFSMIILI